jgi:hypothetical protein
MAQRSSRAPDRSRRVAYLLLGFSIVSIFVPRPVSADEKTECLDAHADAQLLRRNGKIRAARERLLACSAASCPILVSRDCTGWLKELDAEQPTVILAAHDEAGRDVGAVSVTLDGELLTTKLDGRPIEVDPGEHVFRGEFSNRKVVQEPVIIRAKDKGRLVRIDLPASAPRVPPTSDAPPARVPLSAFVLGGVGAVALGSFAYFAASGRSTESDLASTCRRNCSAEEMDGLRRSYLAADISLGVAIVALGAATWIALNARRDPARISAPSRLFTVTFK